MQRKNTFRPHAIAGAWASAATVTLLALTAPAQAAWVSGTLDFSATGFAPEAPVASVTGRVTYGFDDTAAFFNQPDGGSANGAPVQVSVDGVSLPGSWTPVLSYIKVFNGQPVDFFAIGHAPTTIVNAGTDDWRVAVDNTSAGEAFRELTYAVSQSPAGPFMTFTGQVTAVPEPSAWALMIGGLGMLVAARSRRRA